MAAASGARAAMTASCGCRGWGRRSRGLPIAVAQRFTAMRSGPGEMMRPVDWPIRLLPGRIQQARASVVGQVRRRTRPRPISAPVRPGPISSGQARTSANTGSFPRPARCQGLRENRFANRLARR